MRNNIYSHLLPYAIVKSEYYRSDDRRNAGDRMVYANLIDLHNDSLTYKRALAYDFSDEFTEDEDIAIVYEESGVISNWNELTTKLNAVANQYVNKNYTALTEISVNITIDSNSYDYEECKNVEYDGNSIVVTVYYTGYILCSV